jgi:hypothetical protein
MVQFGNNASSKQKSGGQLLNMGNFLDTTNIDHRFDYSEWVRGYGKYLDEQLEVYRELTFYPVSPFEGLCKVTAAPALVPIWYGKSPTPKQLPGSRVIADWK